MNLSSARMRASFLVLLSIVFSSFVVNGCKDKPTYPEYRGERGESCDSRNDCEKGLACIESTCVINEFPFSATASECVMIECTESAQCCTEKPDFLELDCSKDEATLHAEWQDCLAEGSGACQEELNRYTNFDSSLFTKYCECNKTCEDNRCEDVPGDVEPVEDSCEGEDDGTTCSFSNGWNNGVCLSGTCVNCSTDQHCQERRLNGDPMSWSCSTDNICEQTCYNDSNCGKYHACEAGTCVETDGCTSDRECAFGDADTTAFCNKDTGECEKECATNHDCNNGLTGGQWEMYTCDSGICVFVGCESDEECRAEAGHPNTNGHKDYLCRPIAE